MRVPRSSQRPGSSRRSVPTPLFLPRWSVGSFTSSRSPDPRMSAEAPSGWLAQEFGPLLDASDLDERQRWFVRARWFDQMVWFDSKAKTAQRRYYVLRLVAIVGGLIVPA